MYREYKEMDRSREEDIIPPALLFPSLSVPSLSLFYLTTFKPLHLVSHCRRTRRKSSQASATTRRDQVTGSDHNAWVTFFLDFLPP